MAILMIERNRYGILWSRQWNHDNANGEMPNVTHGNENNASGGTDMEWKVYHMLRMRSLPLEIDLMLRRAMIEREQKRLAQVEAEAAEEDSKEIAADALRDDDAAGGGGAA